MALTFTESDLAALKAALLSGASEVSIGDRRVKYKTQKELIEAIRMVEAYLNQSGGSSVVTQTIAPTVSKGKV